MSLTKQQQRVLELAKRNGTDKELLLLDEINALETKLEETLTEVKTYLPNLDEVLNTLKGEKGDMGIGEQGIKGDKGDKGEQGLIGPEGPQGSRGPKGDKGDKGDRGEIGLDGQDGPKGTRGDKGDRGEKGDKGDTGEQGPKGDTGSAIFGRGGHMPISIRGLGIVIDKNVRHINFAGSAITSVVRSYDGIVTVTLTAGGAGGTKVPEEIPTDSGDHINFTIAHTPIANTFQLYRGGSRQAAIGVTPDYTLTGTALVLTTALDTVNSEVLICSYEN